MCIDLPTAKRIYVYLTGDLNGQECLKLEIKLGNSDELRHFAKRCANFLETKQVSMLHPGDVKILLRLYREELRDDGPLAALDPFADANITPEVREMEDWAEEFLRNASPEDLASIEAVEENLRKFVRDLPRDY